MNDSMALLIIISIIRLSTPVIIAGLGNMFSERVGVMNLGAEGMMITGALTAVLGTYFTGNPWIGMLCGMLGGALMASIHSLISVEFGGIQNISGLGINMLAAGLTAFFARAIFSNSMSPMVESIQTTPILKGVPVIGNILAQFSPITYLSIFLVIISQLIVSRTVFGLRMTAVGDDPKTVETAGINVWKLRHLCVILCGLMAGLSGAYLSIGQLNRFIEGMTLGRGMLAVIAVKMGRWNPWRIAVVALIFGFFDAIQLQLQINNTINLPPELIQTLPYVVGIIAIALDSKLSAPPRALREPYVKSVYKF